jgi:ADP-dependent NAD(P)H-hydrate dehydratase
LPTVAAHEPSYMTVGLLCDPDGRIGGGAWQQLSELAAEATAIACGPGLGRSDELTELVAWMYNNLTQPVVFDADALNALAERPAALDDPAGPRILTPHPGAFARLLGRDTREALANRESLAGVFAVRTKAVIVVKGHRSYVTDGQRAAHNTTGNPGMATGGSGDVLTGLITALLCQGLSPFDATRLAVHVHGLAGDLAAREVGQIGLIASDLVRYLPAAFRALEAPVD